VDGIDELARRVSRLSHYRTSRESAEDGLRSLDQLDEPYEEVLADAFRKRGAERLAVELIRLDGFSAIRRPSVARVLGVDEMSRTKIREAVSPIWESAISLNRAIFENAASSRQERQQITDGLSTLSKEADRIVLRLLTKEQADRMAELLVKFPVQPEQCRRIN
jgi:hypothetical protein